MQIPIQPTIENFICSHNIMNGKHALAFNLCLLVMMCFSDSNLDRDDFLKCLMDESGWVPVSKVADFNRV